MFSTRAVARTFQRRAFERASVVQAPRYDVAGLRRLGSIAARCTPRRAGVATGLARSKWRTVQPWSAQCSAARVHVGRALFSAGAGAGGSPGPLGRAWAAYSKLLDAQPIVTNVVTAGVLFGAGDVVAQFIEQIRESGFAWDITRSLRSAFVGAVTSGWMTPLHMRFMDFLFTRGPLAGVAAAVVPWGKLVLDQFVYYAYLNIIAYFVVMGTVQGKQPSEIAHNMHENLWGMVKAGWSWWVPAMIINFNFVPVKFQTGGAYLASLGWVIVLSIKYVAGLKRLEAAEKEQQGVEVVAADPSN